MHPFRLASQEELAFPDRNGALELVHRPAACIEGGGAVLRRHLKIFGSTLRTRPASEKAQIVAAFLKQFGPAFEAGRLRPPIYKAVPASEAPTAHRMMQASEHFGKIVLKFA